MKVGTRRSMDRPGMHFTEGRWVSSTSPSWWTGDLHLSAGLNNALSALTMAPRESAGAGGGGEGGAGAGAAEIAFLARISS